MASAAEHRKHQRVLPLPGRPVEIQLMGGEFLDVLSAKDISQGGVAVTVPHGFAGTSIADEIELIVKLPGRSAFLARGVIRHLGTAGTSFGVEFTSVPEEARRKLAQYIEEMCERGRFA
jgi:c-di-GMP-binding flagellar brake protein YcgR